MTDFHYRISCILERVCLKYGAKFKVMFSRSALGSSWCIWSTKTRQSTQDRRRMCGTCTSRGVGISSLLVTASGNSTRRNCLAEDRPAEHLFHLFLYIKVAWMKVFSVQMIHGVHLLVHEMQASVWLHSPPFCARVGRWLLLSWLSLPLHPK